MVGSHSGALIILVSSFVFVIVFSGLLLLFSIDFSSSLFSSSLSFIINSSSFFFSFSFFIPLYFSSSFPFSFSYLAISLSNSESITIFPFNISIISFSSLILLLLIHRLSSYIANAIPMNQYFLSIFVAVNRSLFLTPLFIFILILPLLPLLIVEIVDSLLVNLSFHFTIIPSIFFNVSLISFRSFILSLINLIR